MKRVYVNVVVLARVDCSFILTLLKYSDMANCHIFICLGKKSVSTNFILAIWCLRVYELRYYYLLKI